MALVETRSLASCSHHSLLLPHQPAATAPVSHTPRHLDCSTASEDSFDHVELSSYLDGLHLEGIDIFNTLDGMSPFGLTEHDKAINQRDTLFPRFQPRHPDPAQHSTFLQGQHAQYRTSFPKWMKTLQRRAQKRASFSFVDRERPWGHGSRSGLFTLPIGRKSHTRSSSGSSFGFVAAVKSASVSLASTSVVTRPKRHTGRSIGNSKTERSSRASLAAARLSQDSGYGDRPTVQDPAATERSVQRRRILEELISTEEGYIGDVRFLMNVYITILASLPALPVGLRSSINRNLTEIVELHEEILGDLHRVVPNSEYTQEDVPLPLSTCVGKGHQRWHSLDAVPEDEDTISWLQCNPYIASEAQIAGDVAKVFSRKMDRFFIYEEYGAKYEMMIQDVASAHRRMPQWDMYQKGLEALASSLGSANSHEDQARKSLTMGDLLVKPIQRICKYPLLFAELLKHTPVEDDPNSHMEVESALLRLREATAEINRATNDCQMKSTLQKTWILQDRLSFPNQRIDASSRNRIRSFGHVRLCGALHVCWQSREGVRGQYMVSLLYQDVLCLASAGKVEQVYTLEACINLNSAKVEEADNGRGLQCHTAPFSWKLVFECDSQLYEIVMTACSAKEQDEWRYRLDRPVREFQEQQMDPNLYSSMALNIKSLGTVFSKPGTVARRISIHRATTVGPKSPLCQVILKNTSVARDVANTSLNSPINRSQSLVATNHRVPILAPHRGERARLEALLSDVWSREILPFPGITSRSRGEHLVRASATTMMRKLSVTSITSSFTKRSNSVVSISKLLADDDVGDMVERRPRLARASRELRPSTEPVSREELESHTARVALPRIQDESDRKSLSSTPSASTFETAQVNGLGRQSSVSRPGHGDLVLEDLLAAKTNMAPGTSIRAPSLRRARENSSQSKNSSCPSYTESGARTRGAKKPKLVHRASSRLGRGGGLNKDIMIQGIRNFFR